jgi:hypothetical protein
MVMRRHVFVGILYLAPALAGIGAWYAILFVGNPTGVTPTGTLRYLLSDDIKGPWLRWFAVLPLLCLGLAGAYLTGIAQTRAWAIALALLGSCVAAAAWLTAPSFFVLVAVPAALGFTCMGAKSQAARHGA